MTQPSAPVYYFTEQDQDYQVQGSRDPLAFQVIWQRQAKQLIPHLSTVSRNLFDFQTLSVAHHLYGPPDTRFVPFLIRLEQVLAYVREIKGKEESEPETSALRAFNGVRKVRATLATDPKTISYGDSSRSQILSNQRAYGIWGKYSRPYRDMQLLKSPGFTKVFGNKLEKLLKNKELERQIRKIITEPNGRISISDVELFSPLLMLTSAELDFYRDHILHEPNSFQNLLFQFLNDGGDNLDYNLYSFIDAFRRSKFSNPFLNAVLTDIEETERVLAPLNRIFRYLQSRPLWPRNDIETDSFIRSCLIPRNYIFSGMDEDHKDKNSLALILSASPWQAVEALVKKNQEVCERRGGAPWMSVARDLLEVHHADGFLVNEQFDPAFDFDNSYFIFTYRNLYRQIVLQ